MNNLYKNVLFLILGKLSTHDVLNFARTSKRNFRIVNDFFSNNYENGHFYQFASKHNKVCSYAMIFKKPGKRSLLTTDDIVKKIELCIKKKVSKYHRKYGYRKGDLIINYNNNSDFIYVYHRTLVNKIFKFESFQRINFTKKSLTTVNNMYGSVRQGLSDYKHLKNCYQFTDYVIFNEF